MKFLLSIPARAGSKSIKNKCLVKVNNKSLIEYTFEQVKKLNNNLSFVLSDSKKIKNIAKKYNIRCDYVRPKNLSKDNTSIADTLYHFVKWTETKKIYFDYLVLLQPTSPLRNKMDIIKSIKKIKKNKLSSLFSISKSLEHPYESIKIKNLNGNKWSFALPKGRKYYRRQDFDFESYFINGAIFIIEKKLLLRKKMRSKKNHGFYLMPKSRSIDINDRDEINILKKLTL